MTEHDFRALALSLPGSEESSHMGHPDFRVGGKIFATLGHRKGAAVVMLSPELQDAFVNARPQAFAPINGSWGLKGATNVVLKECTKGAARDALVAAWKRRAPKKLLTELGF